MKKLLDLILLLLVLGAPVFLFVVLPEREARERRNQAQQLPLPETPTAHGSMNPSTSTPTGGDPNDVSVEEIGRDPEPVSTSTPNGGWRLEGYLYRGASNPMAGEVPIGVSSEGGEVIETDRRGRFTWRLPPGELFLLGRDSLDPAVALDIPDGAGRGIIAVHRFFQGQPGELITPESALILQCPDLGAPQVLVRGSTLLPDGAQVTVRLIAAGYSLESVLLRVREGRFGGELPISDREFHAGAYTLQFAWSYSTSTQKIQEWFEETPWFARGTREVERDLGAYLGTPEEASEQIAAMREFYDDALAELLGARDFILVAGSKARGKRNRLLRDNDRAARLRAHALAPTEAKLFRGRNLDREEWRQLIDERIPAIAQKYLVQDDLPHRYRVPQAAYNLVAVAQQVVRHSRLESQIVYEHHSWPTSPNDYVADLAYGIHAEKTQSLNQLRNYVDAVRDYIEP